MQRILIVVVVLLVVWRILAAIGRRLADRAPSADSFSRFSPEAKRRRTQWTGGSQKSVEELVECTRCGTFVPTGRALTSGEDRTFCSEECRRQSAAASPHAGR
ncbi:MAG: PP0621 family protein [Acidobacteriota bacterium]|nr:PP0621 family protein [Acidobacteriota bacterium]